MSTVVKVTCSKCGADVPEAQELVDGFIADAGRRRELEAKLAILETITAERDYLRSVLSAYFGHYTLPFISYTPPGSAECQHEYPNPWYGIVPPNCMKCGKQAPFSYPTFTTTAKP